MNFLKQLLSRLPLSLPFVGTRQRLSLRQDLERLERQVVHLTQLQAQSTEFAANLQANLGEIKSTILQTNHCVNDLNHFVQYRFGELLRNLEADAGALLDAQLQLTNDTPSENHQPRKNCNGQ